MMLFCLMEMEEMNRLLLLGCFLDVGYRFPHVTTYKQL